MSQYALVAALRRLACDGAIGRGTTAAGFSVASARGCATACGRRGFRDFPPIRRAHTEKAEVDRWAATAPGAHVSAMQRGAGADRVSFAGRARLAGGSGHEGELCFFFQKYFPFNTGVKIILGKILRVFGTTFVWGTLTKGQPNSNEK
jgi:hypothetical protein